MNTHTYVCTQIQILGLQKVESACVPSLPGACLAAHWSEMRRGCQQARAVSHRQLPDLKTGEKARKLDKIELAGLSAGNAIINLEGSCNSISTTTGAPI